jgi:hypothetical protein
MHKARDDRAACFEITFQHHMHILADSGRITIPTTYLIGELDG